MKQFLIATLLAMSLSAIAGGVTIMEPIKKAEKSEEPATPKAMPKVDKPKTKKEKLANCLEKKKVESSVCEKRYGAKKK